MAKAYYIKVILVVVSLIPYCFLSSYNNMAMLASIIGKNSQNASHITHSIRDKSTKDYEKLPKNHSFFSIHKLY